MTSTLHVDLDALVANYEFVARRAPRSVCGAVVKADAYGLGAAYVVPALAAAGCNSFFVATAAEGASARCLTSRGEIFVLEGFVGSREVLIKSKLIPVLNSGEQVSAWLASGGGPAALHVDTGMNRLGCPFAEINALAEKLRPVLLLSHLACSSDPTHPMNREQRLRFDEVRKYFPGVAGSLANSGGVFLGAEYHHDVLRPGIALYGGLSRPGLRDTVRVVSQVIQVRTVKRGDCVGYGATWCAPRPTLLATVGVGYADGYPRGLSNRGIASISGKIVQLVGEVSMDSIVFDVSEIPTVRVGTWLTLMGEDISIVDVAKRADTIPYTLLTSLGGRYRRVYRSEGR